MHSITHNSYFINHSLLIVGVNGAGYDACVRAQASKLIGIYLFIYFFLELYVDERIYGFIYHNVPSVEYMHSIIIHVLCVCKTAELILLIGQKCIFLLYVI